MGMVVGVDGGLWQQVEKASAAVIRTLMPNWAGRNCGCQSLRAGLVWAWTGIDTSRRQRSRLSRSIRVGWTR